MGAIRPGMPKSHKQFTIALSVGHPPPHPTNHHRAEEHPRWSTVYDCAVSPHLPFASSPTTNQANPAQPDRSTHRPDQARQNPKHDSPDNRPNIPITLSFPASQRKAPPKTRPYPSTNSIPSGPETLPIREYVPTAGV